MRTTIPPHLLQDPEVEASEKVLRACVHCGFCNATCPTYLLTGNELEGPRGRIYLIKSVLEEDVPPTRQTVEHIDNCLGCLACETTCPSGVDYSLLLETARPRLDQLVKRPLMDRLLRAMLTRMLPYPSRTRLALRMSGVGRAFSFLMPRSHAASVRHGTQAIAATGCCSPARRRARRGHASAARGPAHRVRPTGVGAADQRRDRAAADGGWGPRWSFRRIWAVVAR